MAATACAKSSYIPVNLWYSNILEEILDFGNEHYLACLINAPPNTVGLTTAETGGLVRFTDGRSFRIIQTQYPRSQDAVLCSFMSLQLDGHWLPDVLQDVIDREFDDTNYARL